MRRISARTGPTSCASWATARPRSTPCSPAAASAHRCRRRRPPTDSLGPRAGHPAVLNLKPVSEGVALVDEDGVDAVLARPAGDRGHDGVVIADAAPRFDPAVEQRADDALVHELLADLELAARSELGHA